jgi:2-haloalkanoic acid dehalogenase type II
MFDFNRFEVLTFDCYGTLIDWRSGIEAGLRRALGPVGLRGQVLLDAYVEAEKKQESRYMKYREVLSRTAASVAESLGVPADRGAADRFAASVPDWPAFPDTRRFLHVMGDRGYKRYILSNVDNDLLGRTIRKNRLEVDGFVTAEEVGSYKPNPAHWMEFLRRTGAKKEDILHVAQSVFHDVVPTQRLGISSAWVNRYHERLPPGASPLLISDSLKSLARFLP